MVNMRRGEVALELDGTPHTLCLTLGALAELEASMALGNIGELAQRFADGNVKSADLIRILGAALRGGGHTITDLDAASMRCNGGAVALTNALVQVLRYAFDPSANEGKEAMSEGAGSVNPL